MSRLAADVRKEPERGEGYAKTTVKNRASRMDQFYRWVWDDQGGYTSNLTHSDADQYLTHLAGQEASNAHKSACRKAVMMLYKWRHHQRGGEQWGAIHHVLQEESIHDTTRLSDQRGTDENPRCIPEHGSVPSQQRLW